MKGICFFESNDKSSKLSWKNTLKAVKIIVELTNQ